MAQALRRRVGASAIMFASKAPLRGIIAMSVSNARLSGLVAAAVREVRANDASTSSIVVCVNHRRRRVANGFDGAVFPGGEDGILAANSGELVCTYTRQSLTS